MLHCCVARQVKTGMTPSDGIDLIYALAFAAGFGAGGLIMIWLLTPHWRLPESRHEIPAMFPMMIGMVAGADLAALIGRTLLGPAVLGMIVGAIAVLRAEMDK